jgi:retinol-binding protein 3
MKIIWCLLWCGFVAAGVVKANEVDEILLSQSEIRQVVSQAINVLKQQYLFPEKSVLATRSLRYKLASGEFYKHNELSMLEYNLNQLLRETTGDSYIEIYSQKPTLKLGHFSKERTKSQKQFGFVGAEVLPGNIGYLYLPFLNTVEATREDLDKAMAYLSEVEAMIIDLRDVEGESVLLAQHIISYFTPPNFELADIVSSQFVEGNKLYSAEVNGSEYFIHNFPLYILNSAFVSGVGEFLSYTLKHFDKAVVIGEQTMGVSHSTKEAQLGQHLMIRFPYATAHHTVTKSNWEGRGVVPDFEIEAVKSLELALQLAREYLQSSEPVKKR